jgi:hypothetical protein
MKHTILITVFFSFWSFIRAEYATLTQIPAQVFAEGGKTDIANLWQTDFDVKSAVETLFYTSNMLLHEGSITDNPNNTFEAYWSNKSKNWKAIRFQEKGEISIVFIGKTFTSEIKENIEIYHVINGKYKQIWSEYGKIIAYHIHPYTKEIILFQHQYPCCESSSHNVFRIRLLNNNVHVRKRFFVGRDKGDMVGPFFPESADHSSDFHYLPEVTILRWSPAEVTENAFINRSESNEIISYNKGASFKILAQQDGWLFVLMFSGIMEGQSAVINYMNFLNTPVYGWIKT